MRKHKRLVECRVNIVDHERCVEQVYGGSRSLGLNANLSLGASLGKWAKGGGGQKKYTCTTGMGGGKMHTGATKVEEVGARGISAPPGGWGSRQDAYRHHWGGVLGYWVFWYGGGKNTGIPFKKINSVSQTA